MAKNHEIRLYIKCTEEEHKKIKGKAKSCNMSMNKMAKYLLLNSEIKIVIET